MGQKRVQRFVYMCDGEVHGPATSSELRRLCESGELDAESFVAREGTQEWIALREAVGSDVSPLPSTTPPSSLPCSADDQTLTTAAEPCTPPTEECPPSADSDSTGLIAAPTFARPISVKLFITVWAANIAPSLLLLLAMTMTDAGIDEAQSAVRHMPLVLPPALGYPLILFFSYAWPLIVLAARTAFVILLLRTVVSAWHILPSRPRLMGKAHALALIPFVNVVWAWYAMAKWAQCYNACLPAEKNRDKVPAWPFIVTAVLFGLASIEMMLMMESMYGWVIFYGGGLRPKIALFLPNIAAQLTPMILLVFLVVPAGHMIRRANAAVNDREEKLAAARTNRRPSDLPSAMESHRRSRV